MRADPGLVVPATTTWRRGTFTKKHPADPTTRAHGTTKQSHSGMEGSPVSSTLVAAPDRDAATNLPRYVQSAAGSFGDVHPVDDRWN